MRAPAAAPPEADELARPLLLEVRRGLALTRAQRAEVRRIAARFGPVDLAPAGDGAVHVVLLEHEEHDRAQVSADGCKVRTVLPSGACREVLDGPAAERHTLWRGEHES